MLIDELCTLWCHSFLFMGAGCIFGTPVRVGEYKSRLLYQSCSSQRPSPYRLFLLSFHIQPGRVTEIPVQQLPEERQEAPQRLLQATPPLEPPGEQDAPLIRPCAHGTRKRTPERAFITSTQNQSRRLTRTHTPNNYLLWMFQSILILSLCRHHRSEGSWDNKDTTSLPLKCSYCCLTMQ